VAIACNYIVSVKGSDEYGVAVNENWTEIFFSGNQDEKTSVMQIVWLSNSWSEPNIFK